MAELAWGYGNVDVHPVLLSHVKAPGGLSEYLVPLPIEMIPQNFTGHPALHARYEVVAVYRPTMRQGPDYQIYEYAGVRVTRYE